MLCHLDIQNHYISGCFARSCAKHIYRQKKNIMGAPFLQNSKLLDLATGMYFDDDNATTLVTLIQMCIFLSPYVRCSYFLWGGGFKACDIEFVVNHDTLLYYKGLIVLSRLKFFIEAMP
ncbi:hypothetical protein GOP47_0006836 [Adiantum capillus-veneris]|uniref:Uncharacterized protein n=1 Tax=Adiantum capillus-veneris TaxID=13818 RepID=A0A9D4ZNE3_ADICA|nr:hypothetical protein GOP47_0006836 [Adiantum capillus-veneris]